MSIIYIKTNDGETIDRIRVEDDMIEDIAQLDYIHAALADALIIAAKKHRQEQAEEEFIQSLREKTIRRVAAELARIARDPKIQTMEDI